MSNLISDITEIASAGRPQARRQRKFNYRNGGRHEHGGGYEANDRPVKELK